MAFRRPHPRQIRTCEEYKAELEEENYHLSSELQTEVDLNRQNEKRIRDLEREYARCEWEIQTLNAKKDVQNREKYVSDLEKRLVESEEQVEKLRCQMATIAELVDAIDGFMDNTTTSRAILINQIKGATRQIHIKNNNLHRDLREVR
ncbi:hypothetical protein RhiirC2_798496 [Rhizophagus irregularis]|uniref:Uncharacterized protein n=1 Tax=Rhizophagus irregularis TaxID=588596 RepID=A0A2N1M6E8_9GLOM|nr:hypothetical protein RhiirC2_798496 [Rhizophagus irregularis]